MTLPVGRGSVLELDACLIYPHFGHANETSASDFLGTSLEAQFGQNSTAIFLFLVMLDYRVDYSSGKGADKI
jgi:hypothetical protein